MGASIEVRSTDKMVLRIDLILSVLLVTFFATKVQYLNCYEFGEDGFKRVITESGQWVAKVDYFWQPMDSNDQFLWRSTKSIPNGPYGPIGRNGLNAKRKLQLRKDFFWRPM